MAELQRHMVGILWLRILRGMALIAILIRQVVVVVDVTGGAVCCYVPTRKRKRRVVMVERCRTPRRRCVAFGAVLTEVARHVVRVCCVVEVCKMATHACRRQALVLVVDMALVACGCHVRPR